MTKEELGGLCQELTERLIMSESDFYAFVGNYAEEDLAALQIDELRQSIMVTLIHEESPRFGSKGTTHYDRSWYGSRD